MKVKLSTTHLDYIRIRTDLYNETDRLIDEFSTQVYNLKDKALREGLIKLGWLPPDCEIKCPCCGSRYYTEELRG